MAEWTDAKPLLTIAIPTYNRSGDLGTMLEVLAPQLAAYPEIDLCISDNASPDDTEAVVRGFVERGLRVRYLRQAENIGSDRNFVTCFEQGRGKYFWMCGDDDVICAGTIAKVMRHLRGDEEIDLLHLTSYGFVKDFVAERQEDPLGRSFHTFTEAREFARVVNIMFTFISGMIVNRERLMGMAHEEPSALLSTNLVQLSWCLPLLLRHQRSVVLWDRPLAGRQGNAGGYALGKVFGRGLRDVVKRLLPGREDLQGEILNPMLRRWLPDILYAMRTANNERIGMETVKGDLRAAFGDNARYWMFADPVLSLPVGSAKVWLKAGAAISKLIYVLTVPGFWRKEVNR